MTTTTFTTPSHQAADPKTTTGRKLWRRGAVAGVSAAVATTSFAAAADAAGVSFAVGGKEIPLLAFAQLTLVGALIGTILAVVLARRASHPQRTFVITTVALTIVSLVPDITADAPTATRIALALSHIVAATIVIPALASRLSD